VIGIGVKINYFWIHGHTANRSHSN